MCTPVYTCIYITIQTHDQTKPKHITKLNHIQASTYTYKKATGVKFKKNISMLWNIEFSL